MYKFNISGTIIVNGERLKASDKGLIIEDPKKANDVAKVLGVKLEDHLYIIREIQPVLLTPEKPKKA